MAAGDNFETEIKLRVRDVAQGRQLLRRAGFRIVRRRLFEANVIFDDQALRLRTGKCLLRIRRCGRRAILTYKHTPVPGRHKSREELETAIERPDTLEAILRRLDLTPVFRYDKYRTEYGRGDGGGMVTLDETPIGVFLELEGAPEWIDSVAVELGFALSDYILASYASLHMEYCRERGLTPRDMLFRAE